MLKATIFARPWQDFVPVVPGPGAAPGAGMPDKEVISLTYGLPDPRHFAVPALIAATRTVLEEQAASALQYGGMAGVRELTDWLVDRARRNDHLPDIEASNFLLTVGSSQALSLVSRLFLDRGDTIIVEAPTFHGALRIFRNAGARIEAVPLDDDGLSITALEVLLARLKSEDRPLKFLYTIPTFQNPSGGTMSLARREVLVKLATVYDFVIVEDDAYYPLNFANETQPPIYSFDTEGRVIRCGTFSKILSPGMRLGWATASPEMILRLLDIKEDGGTSPFAVHVAATFSRAGQLDRYIETLREIYRERCDVMLTALAKYAPSSWHWSKPGGGFFVWVTLPEGYDSEALLPIAQNTGVAYVPGPTFYSDGSGARHLRLSFSYGDNDAIEMGVARLCRAFEQARK